MANKVVIDVEGRFIDNISDEAKDASKSLDDLKKDAKSLDKTTVKPKLDADENKLAKKLKDADEKLDRLGKSKTEVKLSAMDKATAVIKKVLDKANSFKGKTYSALLKIRDSNALSMMNKLSNGLASITRKTWTTVVRIKDAFTSPLTKLKNMLFSVKSLVMAITAGLAAKQLVINPISLADQYSSAKIGFSTLLGESAGQQMMDDLDAFAKATPFKSSQVIGQTQRMLAMGWDAESIIDDMGTIGDAAAATGKGEQGLQQIVTALAQIKTKGRLSTEELNQLAEAGISAKRYLAEGLGYGSGDEGIAKMTKDLEDGAIASGKALEALLSGMKEYEGMMDKTANETVSGLWSQIEDTFEINIFRRWGQGLQDGAKKSFGSIVELIDQADAALGKFGDTIYEVGKKISNWLADKLEKTVERITEITGSFEFKEASLGEKLKMLWRGVIVDPLKEWWEGGGQQKTAETAGKIGAWLGEALTKGLLAVFGITDILDSEKADSLAENGGMSIAQSFADGFKNNFDGSVITDAFVDAISNVWGALPWWAKLLIGGYAAGKVAGGISSFAGGIASFMGGVSNTVGGFNIASSAFPILTSSGSGILGAVGKTGVALGASTTGGALLAGAGGIAGGVAAGASAISGGIDLYKGYTTDDKVEREARLTSGASKIGGVAAGAALGAGIGTLLGGPLIGTLLGAGIGGVVGWIKGNKEADEIRTAKYESEELKEVLEDNKATSEEINEAWRKAKWENAKEHFGDIKLSLSEIERLTDQIVWGDDMGNFETFTSAVKNAEANLQSMKTAAEQADRWMWKASLGVKFNDDEKESFQQAFDDYISSAKSFVENKHYEFTAAVSMLVDVESEEGKSIIDSGNAFYGKMKSQLEELGGKLSDEVEIALEDGVITLDEQKEITNLQQQIAEITTKLANAEQQAELELIKIKFGSGNLDLDSFESFMTQMRATIDERMTANDDAFVASVSSLKLQLEEGAITQEEYDKQLQTLIDGYTSTVEGLQAEVKNVELQIIGEAYAEELGDDAAADLEKALQYAIDEGIDPVEISDDKLMELLNVEELSGETADNIKEMLSGALSHLELLEVDGNLMLKIGEVETDGNVEEKVKESVPDTVEKTVGVDISGEKNIQTTIDILAEDFGIPAEHASTVALLLTGDKELLNQIDVSQLAKEFGIPESQAKDIVMKLTGEKSIENRLNILASEFGVPDSISKTIKINFTAIKGKITNAIGNVFSGGSTRSFGGGSAADSSGGKGFRGGIFGGESAMEAFARGGSTDNSGIVGGSTRFIRVNEESPEMIIPLSLQRRDRALKLWTKTGELLDVPGFARGGITRGDQDEGIRFNNYESDDSVGGQTVQIEVGGITVEIHVDATGTENISEAIRAQSEEIAETVAGILADALGGQFENTPTRGGVA